MELRIEHLTKHFDAATVVDDVSVVVQPGRPFVLLGPSGSGKTTFLRMVCGVETPTSGRIWLNGEDLTTLPPDRRDVAVVFQQPALLPHRTVAENLAYPLLVKGGWFAPLRRWQTVSKDVKDVVVERSEKLGIRHLLERSPATLSGGELQRVALGRALIRGASILLLDEPLSNIDVQLRDAFRMDILHLVNEMSESARKAPILIWVTHDREDAFMLADSLGILVAGKLLQVGNADEVYSNPATRQIAQLTGWPPLSFLHAVVKRFGDGYQIDFAGHGTAHVLTGTGLPHGAEGNVTIGVPPRAVGFAKGGSLRARVLRRRIVGEEMHLLLDTPVGSLSAITHANDQHVGADEVMVDFKDDLLRFFEADERGGRALR